MTSIPASIEQAAGEAGSDALGALLRVSLNDDGSLQQAATQKALGGSIPVSAGVASITNGSQIRWAVGTQAARGPILISSLDNSFSATNDPSLYMGYNQDASGNLIQSGEPALSWAIEGDYNDGSGANKMEAYLQYKNTDNLSNVRPIFIQLNRTTQNVSSLQFSAPIVQMLGQVVTTVTGVNALNSATINLADVSNLLAVGSVVIAGVSVTYTGKTGGVLGSITGCGNHAATVGGETVMQQPNVADFTENQFTHYAPLLQDNVIRHKAALGFAAQVGLGYNAVDDVLKIKTTTAKQAQIDIETATAAIYIYAKPINGTAGGSVSIGGVNDNAAVLTLDNANNSAGVKGLVIRARATSQTGNLVEIQSSGSTPLVTVRPDGHLNGTLGVATKVKAGTPADGDWGTAPPDGTIVVDSSGVKLWVRVGGLWKGVVVA